MRTELRVNGVSVKVEATPDTPLLWVLRDELGLTGTKFGCGMGLCGACVVHVAGQPVRSCVTPMRAVLGKSITTIEGVAGERVGHAVQQAWLTLGVPQCGYCQAGQIMSAVALLRESPRPTDEDVNSAMAGNICRCGTYLRIRAAIQHAAEQLRSTP
ncbi:MAG TPA: (2Fe-2S)-binding protein [Steroidobacteraceae bacterium]|nr:(2Fe-2S)-binding protein [Steroidobacteraceae bacterium]